MEKATIIQVKSISKTFKIPHEKTTSLRQAALSLFKKKSYSNFHVLDKVSFEIYEGEFFGIVGRNGCGKSTLLKILAGIYAIDSGEITIKGKVSPFLELGVGFNPELSGKENVYLNGAILGLSKKEISEKFEEIVKFSELEDFMDQKLKNYSSGMQVRLAFSVAIHAHAPIILLDEVLAVGDARFQKKCNDVFWKLKKEGRTIVFVTHDMEAVKEYCDRALLIANGKVSIIGDPREVAKKYLSNNENHEAAETKNLDNNFLIKEILINNQKKNKLVPFGEKINFQIKFAYEGAEQEANVHVAVLNEDNENILFSMSKNQKKYTLKKNTEISLNIEEMLSPGNYHLALSIHNVKNGESYYGNTNLINFRISSVSDNTGDLIRWL